MTRRKDQGDDTPMLDLVASLAGAEPAAGHDDAAEARSGEATADEDPMAGILADAGVSVDDAETAAAAFIETAAAEGEEARADEVGSDETEAEVEATESAVEDTPEADVGAEPIAPESDRCEVEVKDASEQNDEAPAEPVSQPAQKAKPPTAPVGTPSDRILLRQDVLDIAAELEAGRIGKRTAVRRIREVCEDDAVALDLDDIEVDFDAVPEDRSGLSFLAGLGAPKPQPKEVDPVEVALLAAIKLRDRVSALSIVGDTPTAADREAYKDALRKLRDTLTTHIPE